MILAALQLSLINKTPGVSSLLVGVCVQKAHISHMMYMYWLYKAQKKLTAHNAQPSHERLWTRELQTKVPPMAAKAFCLTPETTRFSSTNPKDQSFSKCDMQDTTMKDKQSEKTRTQVARVESTKIMVLINRDNCGGGHPQNLPLDPG